MSAAKKNKFLDLSRDELIRALLELEDENAKLRPAPAKYKLGQVLAYGTKNPIWNGQPTAYFQVLSVENRMGKWHYGYQKSGIHGFGVFPEDKCRALTATELDGTSAATTPVASEASTLGAILGTPGHVVNTPAPIAPVAGGWPMDNPEDMF